MYFVFEYVQGGELFRLLRREKLFPNDVALFYAAEVVAAFEHLHELDIIYRDLKPENCLIGDDGHLKLTDFGFAKKTAEKTKTVCGTPEYLAPEIILQKGHGPAADWWALGVLIYEMLAGYQPFYDSDPTRVYRKITRDELDFPDFVSKEARLIIIALMQKDPDMRLGSCENGSLAVQKHCWFSGIDWELVKEKKVAPPWVPTLKNGSDYSHFEQYPDSGGFKEEPSGEE